MSGWQRIGVAISVLWLVGLVGAEYFSIANYNSHVSAEYGGAAAMPYWRKIQVNGR